MYYICEWRCHGKSGVDGGVCNPTDHTRSHVHFATHQQKQCDMSGPTLDTLALSTLRSRGTPHVAICLGPLVSPASVATSGTSREHVPCRQKRGSERERERKKKANFDLKQQRSAFKKISMQFDQVGEWSMRNTNGPKKLMAGQQLQVLCLLTTMTKKHFHESRWVPNDWIYCFSTTVLESTDRYGSETQTHQ